MTVGVAMGKSLLLKILQSVNKKMKVSCIFKTSDGREFLSKEDAYKHQALLNDLSNNPPGKLIK